MKKYRVDEHYDLRRPDIERIVLDEVDVIIIRHAPSWKIDEVIKLLLGNDGIIKN